MKPLLLASLCCVAVCASTGAFAAPYAYEAPNRPVVRTADDAVLIAYGFWRAMAPDSRPVSEQDWRKWSLATLTNGVWKVTTGALGFYVGAQDGRYFGAFDVGTPTP